MPEYPDTAYVTLAPDWVCEVLSASTRKVDLHEKRPIYAREGVCWLWLVDPIDRTLEVFELHDGQWLLIAEREGRRAGEHPPVRCGLLQPRRSLGRKNERTATCLTVRPRERAKQSTLGAEPCPPLGEHRADRRISGQGAGEALFTY